MKIEENPLLSICIPTRNRQKYCKEAIKTILANSYENFELVIQDNSDDDSLQEFVLSLNDSRLKYFYIGSPLSSIENINLSAERTIGEYICMIGDDDSVLPFLFEMVEYAKQKHIESICTTCLPAYIWPNGDNNGTLRVSRFKNTSKITSIDVPKTISKLFNYGIIDYQQYYLPRLYHGIIHRSLLEKVKEKIGVYFGGLSPDIYSTISLASLVKNHVIINLPISIAGACPQSTTSQNQQGGHRGKLSDAPHLKYKQDYQWHYKIPEFYSVETIWGESGMKAAMDFGLDKEMDSFDINYFIFVSLLNNRSIKNIILKESFRKVKKSHFYFGLAISLCKFCFKLVQRAVNKFVFKKDEYYKNVNNIDEAISILVK